MTFRLLLGAALAASTITPAFADSGATVYQRCAACHLPSRAGVPGAFPPLTQEPARLAQSQAGRRYLVLAISRGLMGAVTSGTATYRGVMPAQGLTDSQAADVLNFLISSAPTSGKKPAPFSAAEVKNVRASGSNLSAAQVTQLRPK